MLVLQKKNILFCFILIIGISSCEKTDEVIKIERITNDIPIKIIYNTKYNKITGGKMFFTFKICNNSFVKRYLKDVCYYHDLARQTSIVYNDIEMYNKIGFGQKIAINNSKFEVIVVAKPFQKNDTIILIDFSNMKPDSIFLRKSDTIKIYNYRTFDELSIEMPELLEYYLKGDSIQFEFDDSELPFYVKRSKFKQELGGKIFEGNLEHPTITVPIIGD